MPDGSILHRDGDLTNNSLAKVCNHFSIRKDGGIVCRLCGAKWVIDWTGPAHWEVEQHD